MVLIVNHSASTGDPFFQVDPDSHQDRWDFYNIYSIPNLFIDGIYNDHPTYTNVLDGWMSTRLAVDSPVEIDITAQGTGESIEVSVIVNSAETAVSGAYKLRVGLQSIFYDDFFAPNGQSEWHYDNLTMLPDFAGMPFTIEANSSEEYEFSFEYPVYLGIDEQDWSNLNVYAYIQDTGSRESLQANWVTVTRPQYDHRIATSDRGHLLSLGDNCTIEYSFRNNGDADDSYDVVVNDELPEGWTYTYSTPAGEFSSTSSFSLNSMGTYEGTITIQAGDQAGEVGDLSLDFISQNQIENNVLIETRTAISPSIIAINLGEPFSGYYSDLLAGSGIDNCIVWQADNVPFPAEDLQNISAICVMLFGGEDINDEATLNALETYLNDGGSLLISGSELVRGLRNAPFASMLGYNGTIAFDQVENIQDYTNGEFINPDFQATLGGGTGAGNQGTPQYLNRVAPGSKVLTYNGAYNRPAAIKVDNGTYKTLTMGFPLEALTTEDDRYTLMQAILGLLVTGTGVDDDSEMLIPSVVELSQNYPNPFNPATSIEFELPKSGYVNLTVFDIQGRQVIKLLNQTLVRGRHEVQFDGRELASGIYFYSLKTEEITITRKMVLCK